MKKVEWSIEETKDFTKEIAKVCDSSKRAEKAVRKLVSWFGFVEVKDGNAHHHLTHPRIPYHKFTIGCSPSCAWGDHFAHQVRRAIYEVADFKKAA